MIMALGNRIRLVFIFNSCNFWFQEEERKSRAARRQFREKRLLRLISKEKEAVRQQSSMWIEEKDLERRILDALVDPFYLSGSYALPDRDEPMSIGDDSDEDDE